MNYEDGGYTIVTFDNNNQQVQKASVTSYLEGVEAGRDLVARGDAASFIVQRCIHNSLDQNIGCYVTPERERELTT